LRNKKGLNLMSKINYTTLYACLADLADGRHAQGKRYEWLYLLTLIAAALLAGQRSLTAMGQWLLLHKDALLEALEPKRRCLPSLSTLRRVLCAVDIAALEAQLAAYTQTLDQQDAIPGSVISQAGTRLQGQALDGKTVRGASAPGAKVHLVSVVRHESATVLAQTKVVEKRDERQAAKELFANVPLAGRVTTMDALHTQRWEAETILAAQGDYLMVVKPNQRTLYQDIQWAFEALPPLNRYEQEYWDYQRHEAPDRGHGRLERRILESTTRLNDFLSWPGVAQVLRRTCWRQDLRTKVISQDVHFGITSLDRQTVTLAQVEQFWRWHWTIENCTHYPRDVSMGEDASQVRSGNAPQALAAFRNAIISALRLEGWSYMPNAFRHFCHNLQDSLHFIGALST
jgi:predicted transposase YbfD/YdcC